MNTDIQKDTIVQRKNDLLTAESDGEIMMMSLENEAYFGLGETGSRVWALLEYPTCASTICESLMQEFNVTKVVCERDIVSYLSELYENGLLTLP